MTDRELMQQAFDVMLVAIKAGDWKVDGACDPDYVFEALRARLSQCTRCGKVNPAEIHTCTPKQAKPVAWLDSLDRAQPHAVTGFQYLSVSQIERGEQHKYIPVYADPLPDYVDRRQWLYNPMTGEPLCSKLPHQESGCAECSKKASDGWALYCVECSKPMREWVGLTDEEIKQGNKESWVTTQAWESAVWWAEKKLKEKNG